MGTADLAERSVLQGLIKLAAAYVHAVRGNLSGVARNLSGARSRLTSPGAAEAGAALAGLDVAVLVREIDLRLAELTGDTMSPRLGPPGLRRSVR